MHSGSRLFFDGSYHGNMLVLGNGDNGFHGARSVLNHEESSKRRLFFSSSAEDIYDQEFYDEQLPEKKRRLTADQVLMLEKSFEAENKLEPDRKTKLAKKLGLQPRQVAVWFQNRRARWKTKQLERDYDLLKSSYNSLLSNYDSIVKETEKLKSEVVLLNGKLQTSKEFTGMVEAAQKHDPPILFKNKNDDDDTATNDVLEDCAFKIKTEDHLSSGSGGSAVVDEHDGRQLVDSGDSYFPDSIYHGYMGPVDVANVQSEEDDGSDDNQSYWAAENLQEHDAEPLNWWIWP
ncbi:hypothetical protein MKW98_027961 [Papaver atlanticum]|uniref:Homeobox-leucine zipper protein n=1 Tax=Papaver atlanticum TaxID=357466 RepID=A0AAD4SMJ4_9MAGN|nr:hypothetical protein MKW98_027961 [Papaver atlanticum]